MVATQEAVIALIDKKENTAYSTYVLHLQVEQENRFIFRLQNFLDRSRSFPAINTE
jgi:hypothetical protein